MAILAPFAQFGVLASLIVPTDAAATTANIADSLGLFGAAIAAFLVVAILDVAVAWGMYVLLRPVNERARPGGRVAAGGLRGGIRVRAAQPGGCRPARERGVRGDRCSRTSSTRRSRPPSPHSAPAGTWPSAIFGLHLVGLGGLLYRSADFPRFLGALVVLAGAGYLADSFGRIFVPGYTLTISTFTFVGEALLIVWLFKVAIKGSRSIERPRAIEDTPVGASQAVAS